MDFSALTSGLAPQRCAVCQSTSGLLRCSSCKVVSYCGAAHQSVHRPEHKAACASIKRSRELLDDEEAALRASPGDAFFTPADVFNTGVGRFWGLLGTRDYMRARFAAANALLQVDTVSAIEQAIEHFTDMLRLCRSDNLGVRDIIPSLLLRLGREQECYDFLKWWAIIDDDDHYGGSYDWGDVTLPYMDIHGADAFESIDIFHPKNMSLSHLVTLTLLKLRLRLDLIHFEELDFGFDCDESSDEFDRPTGALVREKIRTLDDIETATEALQDQYCQLCKLVNDANPHFWEAFLDESIGIPSPPPYYSQGDKDEAYLVLYQCKRAWEETEDAILMIESEIAKLVRPYKGPSIVSMPGNVGLSSPATAAEAFEKRRGTGIVFPSRFQPPFPMLSPAEIFPAAAVGSGQIARFVCLDDPSKVLAYADGACSNNGMQEPRAGWAVVCGPPVRGDDNNPSIVARRLERKGPFGNEFVATSNRAELRAAIAVLRFCDWRADGFKSVVIATDSTYVVDGATGWAKGWVRNGWKTRIGDNVKNRDLWELLLGEVERWKDLGLQIELWKIPRDLNGDADAAAKAAARDEVVDLDFRDTRIGPALGSVPSIHPGSRILALCLENELLFEDCFGRLISKITSRVTMDRATTHAAALDILSREPPPPVIIIADSGITSHQEVFERVIDRLYEGATVVVAGCFSTMATLGQFNRFFAKLGLPWKQGSYERTTTILNTRVVGDYLARRLPSAYSQKALFVKNVKASDAWYPGDESDEAAVAVIGVGNGRLGYIGDVNGEEHSDEVVLAMCGLLF